MWTGRGAPAPTIGLRSASRGEFRIQDLDGDPVFLAENAFSLNYEADRAPGMVFDEIKDYQIRAKAA